MKGAGALRDQEVVTMTTAKERIYLQRIFPLRIRSENVRRKEKITAELQLHSDQGFQYTSHAYFKLTKSYNITPSMSSRGNPYDNAMAENFFSILKTECIHRVKLETYEEARLLIDEYIRFYNNDCIQPKQNWLRFNCEASMLLKTYFCLP